MAMNSVLALVGVSFLGVSAQELAFAPEPGTRLVKAFESSLDLELEELTLQLTEWPEPLSHLWHDITVAERRRLVLIDEYVALLDDRPRNLLRTFESLSLEQRVDSDNLSNDGDFHATYEGHSGLEGTRVRFTTDADDAGYAATFDGEGDPDLELLEGLEEDLDLRAFLPSGAEKTRSAWKVDAAALRSLFEPGGRIRFVDARGNGVQSFDPGFVHALQGTLQVEFAGRRDVDGAGVAVLRIHGRSTASSEPVESEGDVQFGLGYTSPGINCVRASLELEVEGEILWDLEGAHLHSSWLAADAVVKRETHGRPTDGFAETWIRETWEGEVCFEVQVARE